MVPEFGCPAVARKFPEPDEWNAGWGNPEELPHRSLRQRSQQERSNGATNHQLAAAKFRIRLLSDRPNECL